MKRYKPPSLLQAMNMILSAQRDLEGILRSLEVELAKAKEVSQNLDEAINCVKSCNLREPKHERLRESMTTIMSSANVIRKTVRRQASGMDYIKMASNLIGSEIAKHLLK